MEITTNYGNKTTPQASNKYVQSSGFTLSSVPKEQNKSLNSGRRNNVLSSTKKQGPVHHLWRHVCDTVPGVCSVYGAVDLYEFGDSGVSFGLDAGLGDIFPGDDDSVRMDQLVFF